MRDVGASGSTSAIGKGTAVLSAEVADSPRSLIAVTLAMTSAKSAKSKGDTLSVGMGIVHWLAEMIELLFSASQSVESITNTSVAVLTSSLYPSIGSPPRSVGGLQSKVIDVSPLIVAVGALGCDGKVAATMVKTAEYSLKPTPLRALTLNL